MDSLANKASRRAVREALKRLSKGVDEIYDEAMKRIEGQSEDDRTLAKAVFAWITYAHRPLTLNELQHAVAVVPDMKNMDPDALVDEQILISVCAGLVVVEEESSIIRLIRKYHLWMLKRLDPYSSQTIRRRSISKASERLCSRMLRPTSQRHA
jgi:hypothetical protein